MTQSVRDSLADAETLRRCGWTDALMRAAARGNAAMASMHKDSYFPERAPIEARLAARAAFRACPLLRGE